MKYGWQTKTLGEVCDVDKCQGIYSTVGKSQVSVGRFYGISGVGSCLMGLLAVLFPKCPGGRVTGILCVILGFALCALARRSFANAKAYESVTSRDVKRSP